MSRRELRDEEGSVVVVHRERRVDTRSGDVVAGDVRGSRRGARRIAEPRVEEPKSRVGIPGQHTLMQGDAKSSRGHEIPEVAETGFSVENRTSSTTTKRWD